MVLLQSDEWDCQQGWEFYDAMVHVAEQAKKSGAKSWFAHINVDDCFRSVSDGRLKAVRVDDHFVIVYCVGVPWYNSELRVLSEMLVIRIRAGGDYRKVLRALDILAEDEQCRVVCVGDALTQDKRLARVYQRAGFRSESEQLIKEL